MLTKLARQFSLYFGTLIYIINVIHLSKYLQENDAVRWMNLINLQLSRVYTCMYVCQW